MSDDYRELYDRAEITIGSQTWTVQLSAPVCITMANRVLWPTEAIRPSGPTGSPVPDLIDAISMVGA